MTRVVLPVGDFGVEPDRRDRVESGNRASNRRGNLFPDRESDPAEKRWSPGAKIGRERSCN